jgi:hypothetical protein
MLTFTPIRPAYTPTTPDIGKPHGCNNIGTTRNSGGPVGVADADNDSKITRRPVEKSGRSMLQRMRDIVDSLPLQTVRDWVSRVAQPIGIAATAVALPVVSVAAVVCVSLSAASWALSGVGLLALALNAFCARPATAPDASPRPPFYTLRGIKLCVREYIDNFRASSPLQKTAAVFGWVSVGLGLVSLACGLASASPLVLLVIGSAVLSAKVIGFIADNVALLSQRWTRF